MALPRIYRLHLLPLSQNILKININPRLDMTICDSEEWNYLFCFNKVSKRNSTGKKQYTKCKGTVPFFFLLKARFYSDK